MPLCFLLVAGLLFFVPIKGMEHTQEDNTVTQEWQSLCRKVWKAKIITHQADAKSLIHLILKNLTTTTTTPKAVSIPSELEDIIKSIRKALTLLDQTDNTFRQALVELLCIPHVLDVIADLRYEELLLFLAVLPQEALTIIPLPAHLSEAVRQVRAVSTVTIKAWQEKLKNGDIYFVEEIESSTEYPAIVSLLLESTTSLYQKVFLLKSLINSSAKRNHSATLHFLQAIRAPELNALGCRPLYWAVFCGHYDLVVDLLEDPIAKRELEITKNMLLMIAEQHGHTAIADILRQAGATSTLAFIHEDSTARSFLTTSGNTYTWQELFYNLRSILH